MTVCCINGSVNDAPKSTTAELINNLRQRQRATQIFVDTDQMGDLQRLCIFEIFVPLKARLLLIFAEVSNTLSSVKFKHNHVMTNFHEIHPLNASPEIAAISADIRAVSGLAMVGLIWLHFAA